MPTTLRAMIVTNGSRPNAVVERWLRALPSIDVIAYTTDVAQAIVLTTNQPVDLLVLDPELSDAARHILVHHAQATTPAPFLMPLALPSTAGYFTAAGYLPG